MDARNAGRRWKARRTVSFFAGLITVDLALQSPVATLTGSYFEAHVIQHLLLMIIGPGADGDGGSHDTDPANLEPPCQDGLACASSHSKWFAVLSHPLVVWVLYYGVMLAFFLTPTIGFAMSHMWLMDLNQPGFPVRSDAVLVAMIGLDPIPRWGASYPLRMVNS